MDLVVSSVVLEMIAAEQEVQVDLVLVAAMIAADQQEV